MSFEATVKHTINAYFRILTLGSDSRKVERKAKLQEARTSYLRLKELSKKHVSLNIASLKLVTCFLLQFVVENTQTVLSAL